MESKSIRIMEVEGFRPWENSVSTPGRSIPIGQMERLENEEKKRKRERRVSGPLVCQGAEGWIPAKLIHAARDKCLARLSSQGTSSQRFSDLVQLLHVPKIAVDH